MKGDVLMLEDMAKAWKERFQLLCGGSYSHRELPGKRKNELRILQQKLSMQDVNCSDVRWIDHLRYAFKGSCSNSIALLEKIPAISFRDIPLSSVDFHCSSVVEALFKEGDMKRRMWSALPRMMRTSEYVDEEVLSERIRRTLWLFRSSINHKVSHC